jgi:hypothetical protein
MGGEPERVDGQLALEGVELHGINDHQPGRLQPLQRHVGRVLDRAPRIGRRVAHGHEGRDVAALVGIVPEEPRRTPIARSSSGLGSVTNTASCAPMTMSFVSGSI